MKFRTGESLRCCGCKKKSPFKFVSTSDSEIAKFGGLISEELFRDLVYSFSESVVEVAYTVRKGETTEALPVLAVSCSGCGNFLHKENVPGDCLTCRSPTGGYRGTGSSVYVVSAKNGLYGPMCPRCLTALAREIESKGGGPGTSVSGFKMGLSPDLLKSLYASKTEGEDPEEGTFEAIL